MKHDICRNSGAVARKKARREGALKRLFQHNQQTLAQLSAPVKGANETTDQFQWRTREWERVHAEARVLERRIGGERKAKRAKIEPLDAAAA